MVTFRVFARTAPRKAHIRLVRISPAQGPLNPSLPLSRSLHSTPFLPITSALFCATALSQPFFFQSLAHSFHRHGECTPFSTLRRSTVHSPSTAKSFGITSFAHPYLLSPIDSHRYKNHGGRERIACTKDYLPFCRTDSVGACPGSVGAALSFISHESRFSSPVPLRKKGHRARMFLNVVIAPQRETTPLLPVSKSSSRADAGCGNFILPIPGQGSCH
jgi:hypothetical protein